MNSSKRKKIQLIAGLLVILAVPVLFFQLMGGSLLHMNGHQKRIIAIVNEDLGVARDGEPVEMGKEVVSILSDNSEYEWKVMGRGTATNGLKSNQYDAIVYIPSDFSNRVMSYDEQSPEKAEFTYQVQRQKDGLQKERVLREIDEASNRVNEKISTLYWSYVANEMDHIKKEFDKILTKETEFLDAMSAYYMPGSEQLAEKMRQQKEQVEGLRSLIGNAGEAHASHIQSTEAFSSELSEFISYVEKYKYYQAEQKELLLHMQSSSLEKIKQAAAVQTERYNESLQTLEENNEELNSRITEVNEAIDANKERLLALAEMRQQQVSRQVEELLTVQGTAIDRYAYRLFNRVGQEVEAGKKGELSTGSGQIDGLPYVKDWAAIKEQLAAKTTEKAGRTTPNLAEEQQEMQAILAGLSSLKSQLGEDEASQQLGTTISQLESEMLTLNEAIMAKAQTLNEMVSTDTGDYRTASSEFNELQASFEMLAEKYESLKTILENNTPDQAAIRYAIELKEQELLKNPALSAVEKEQLGNVFKQNNAHVNFDSLLAYFAKLDQYEFMLEERQGGTTKQELLQDDRTKEMLEEVVELNVEELESWKDLGTSIPETELSMENVSTSFAAIMSGYEKSMEEQHTELQNDLNTLDEQASALLAQLQSTEGEPAQNVSEGQVMGGQQNVSSQLASLSSQMVSLSERQNGLVNYASDLYGKANDIKESSLAFGNKWQKNLTEMSAFKDDIQSYLANTYVDGQENGYVFNYLVNPLEVKGEAVVADEMTKVPPLILFIILLLSSLAIGFFAHRIKGASVLWDLGMITILSLLVGLIISLYSVNMYILRDDRAIQWTIFTILLLLAGSAIIKTALDISLGLGWLASIVLMGLYIMPLLVLGVPEIKIPDLVSKVFISIKYDPETLFGWGTAIVATIAICMLTISYFVNRPKNGEPPVVEEI